MINVDRFEIDFLPVGNGARSGDAIAIRYGTDGNYKVLVYDGGTKESGQALVNHIQRHYGTSRVDYVVNSHPDADHASGLSVILDQLEVGELWMHQPWEHSKVILDYFKDGRITDNSLAERLKEKMLAAYTLEKLAEEKGIPVYAPYQGAIIGNFTVLSPEKDWYVHDLIAEFAKSPEKKKAEVNEAANRGWTFDSIIKAASNAINWVREYWGEETLRSDVKTSAENESSVVLYANLAGKGVLLTGDAGIGALDAAATYSETIGVSLPNALTFVQVPHHGSRHNVSSEVLDRILGPRKATDDGVTTKFAYASVGAGSSTHPRPVVVNAFIRRGVAVVPTKGMTLQYSSNMPDRDGWGAVSALPFISEVEAWD